MSQTITVFFNIMPAVFTVLFCFIGIGATISVIPIYVKTQLGFSSFIVGIVIAAQYIAMLLARPTAGSCVDAKGAKTAIQRGLLFFFLCGLGYLWSVKADTDLIKLIILIVSRLLLGIGESYIITGALAWAIRHVGQSNAGMVMSWNGNAMYGGIAIGAPIAGLLSSHGGFEHVAWMLILLSIMGVVITFFLLPYDPINGKREPFHKTLAMIAGPGFGLLLASVGYGTILGFSNLFFQHNNWNYSFFAISSFGFAYVGMRVFFGWLPDKYGGVKVAFWSLIIESIGQALLFSNVNEYVALLGTILSGAGFSLVVPALGVEAVRRVSMNNSGSAMAGYLAFFDLSFVVAIPIAGIISDIYTVRMVYLFGLLCAIAGLSVVVKMKYNTSNYKQALHHRGPLVEDRK